MGRCTQCFNELTTGDSHWELGLCNKCWEKIHKEEKEPLTIQNFGNYVKCFDCNTKDQRIAELQKDKEVLEKALELAIEEHDKCIDKYCPFGNNNCFVEKSHNCKQCKFHYFIQQADKELGGKK